MLQRVTPYETRHLPAAFSRLGGLIGNTPMLKLTLEFEGEERIVLAKHEATNFSGSVKDRMAFEVLRAAYGRGELRPGDVIVEATSGNAGIAFAALGRALGHRVVIFMPDWMSVERVALMQAYGAEVRLVSRNEGGFLGAIALAADLARDRCVFAPRQFENLDNSRAHARTTGPEILAASERAGLKPAAFVAGVGTGGTVMGVGHALRRANPDICVHPVEPLESPTLSTGHKVGSHRIQGVSDDFIPAIVDLEVLDDVIGVSDGDAILMAQTLCRECGLGVGISSGANLIAALKAGSPDRVVATLFADCAKKYLSTDFSRKEPARDDYLTPRCRILELEVI